MKKVATVVGLGISGYGAALLLGKKGWKVKVTEEKKVPDVQKAIAGLSKAGIDIEFEIGSHTPDFIKGSELVVTSPGARDDSGPLSWASAMNIPVIDEIELGYRYCPAPIVAVTGTNGKSTTATLIGEVLRSGGYNAVVCGNIGYSFCEKALGISKKDIAVVEVSSFQLQRTDKFRPKVAVFLNITQNHFDRHRDFREYLRAKLNIFRNQKRSDWAIMTHDDRNLARLAKSIRPGLLYFGTSHAEAGAFLKDGAIYLSGRKKAEKFLDGRELKLRGEHNLMNVMAAALVGSIYKVDLSGMQAALAGFQGLGHRCERAGERGGVVFIDDSKATTVDAAMCAIRSLNGKAVLIAGGRDKGSDFTVLRPLAHEKLRALVLIGEAATKIKTQLLGCVPIYDARDMKTAVFLGSDLAKPGDAVILSPMCASFDMFKNFEERGRAFKQAVSALRGRQTCKIR